MRYYIQRHSHRIAKAFLALALLLGLAFGTKYILANRGEIGKLDDSVSPTTESDTSPEIVSSRSWPQAIFHGGGSLYARSEDTLQKSAYPFSGLTSLSRNEYDVWMGNLVCSLEPKPTIGSDTSCATGYLVDAKKWFNVLLLGNSNSNDQASVAAARDLLKSSGIQFVGDREISAISQICKVLALPARSRLGDGSFKAAQLPLVVCSINASETTPDKSQYDEVARLSEYLPVWVYASMGETSVIGQSELQKSVYRSFIDVGADLVVGNHPYAVQGAENYKGKLIMYSLGNFIYQGVKDDPEYSRSVSLKVGIGSKADTNMLGWMENAKECTVDSETCLKSAKTKRLQKPTYGYSFSIVTADSTSGVTSKTEDAWEEQAAKRLDWEALLPTLSYTKLQ